MKAGLLIKNPLKRKKKKKQKFAPRSLSPTEQRPQLRDIPSPNSNTPAETLPGAEYINYFKD